MSRITAVALAMQALMIAAILTVALDRSVHLRVEQTWGTNVWGYRGHVARHKPVTDVRLAVIGGRLAFGDGLESEQTMAAGLKTPVESAVNHPGTDSTWVTVANLGGVGLPARAYDDRLARFASLDIDVTVIVPDLVDTLDREMPPRESGVTALTGYVPMLPLFAEKRGRQLSAGGHRLAGAMLAAAGRAVQGADRAVFRLVHRPGDDGAEDLLVSVGRVVHAAFGLSKGVVVVIPPAADGAAGAVREQLLEAVSARADSEQRLALVDLGATPAFADPALRSSGGILGEAGQRAMIDAVVPAVLRVLMKEKGA